MQFLQRVSSLFFFILLINNLSAQEPVFWPKDSSGKKVVSEKFDMLEKTIPQLQNLDLPNDVISKDDHARRNLNKANGEIQIGDDSEVEFEMHAIVNPNDPNNIIVGCMNYDQASMTAPVTFRIYVTKDFGDTWTKSEFTGRESNETILGGGDPMFAFDSDGTLVFSWLHITANQAFSEGTWAIYTAKSTDGGITWIRDVQTVVESTFTDLLTFSDLTELSDKEWMAYDNNPASPHFGNIYMAYVNIIFEGIDVFYDISVKRKLSGESNFSEEPILISNRLNSLNQYTSIDVNTNGEVYVTFLSDDNDVDGKYAVHLSESIDGGETFTEGRSIVDFYFPEIQSGDLLISGISPNRLYPCPHLVIDKSNTSTNGYMYLTFTSYGIDDVETTGLDVYLMRSEDNGQTWSTPITVNDDIDPGSHQFYSSIAINEDGNVVMGWYDRRADVVNNLTEYFVGVSEDKGQSFTQNNASTAPTDFNVIGTKNISVGIGEYTQVLTTGDYVVPVWSDGRTNDGDIAIYASFLRNDNISSTAEKLTVINSNLNLIGPNPNPVSDFVKFRIENRSSNSVKYEIVSMDGKIVETSKKIDLFSNSTDLEIDVRSYEEGVYLFYLLSEFGTISRKFIVSKK